MIGCFTNQEEAMGEILMFCRCEDDGSNGIAREQFTFLLQLIDESEGK